jgi:hypothetical protein
MIRFEYHYIENEGAFYRRKIRSGWTSVDEVWIAQEARWETYRGDGLKRGMFGCPITRDQLPQEAG